MSNIQSFSSRAILTSQNRVQTTKARKILCLDFQSDLSTSKFRQKNYDRVQFFLGRTNWYVRIAQNSDSPIQGAAKEGRSREGAKVMAGVGGEKPEYVYRISTAKEWEVLQSQGFAFGGDLDKSTGRFHLSNLEQVRPILERFLKDIDMELYLLQIDTNKLGDGLVYELREGYELYPLYYGPSRSFAPLPLEAVTKAEKITRSNGEFICSLLD